MVIATDALGLIARDIFFEAPKETIVPARLVLKLEGISVTGSIKVKSALFMLADLEERGVLQPGISTIVESSSGNLGVALALLCRLRNYRFICVVDPNISPSNAASIRAYGGRLSTVTERDADGGYLQTRLDRVQSILQSDPLAVWPNQYANHANIAAHAEWTGREILNSVPNVTHVYVGTGTTGTAMGISRCFRQLRPNVRIVGVEPIGSVTFGKHASAPRKIPGIGTSVAPPLADRKALCDLRYIPETDAIRSCHHLLREFGLLLGGSTGSVFAAVLADTPTFDANDTVVMIAPDSGEKYLDTIYNPQWVLDTYGELASFGFAGDAERPTVGRLQQTVNSSALVPNREGVA